MRTFVGAAFLVSLIALGVAVFRTPGTTTDPFSAAGVSIPSGTSAGSVNGGPQFNAGASFPVGLTLGQGPNQQNQNSGNITIGAGANQGAWLNNTGHGVSLDTGAVYMTGTASSTFNVYVGTSTKATATDQFNLTTAPFWSQFIDAAAISTSTPAGIWADNINNHKSGKVGTLYVPSGTYVLMVANTFCKASGACETATSTNRGWSSLNLSFTYYW